MEPDVGTIKAYHATWSKNEAEKVKTPIKLVDCSQLQKGQSNNEEFNIVDIKKDRMKGLSRFLCPVGLDKLNLHGGINSDNF